MLNGCLEGAAKGRVTMSSDAWHKSDGKVRMLNGILKGRAKQNAKFNAEVLVRWAYLMSSGEFKKLQTTDVKVKKFRSYGHSSAYHNDLTIIMIILTIIILIAKSCYHCEDITSASWLPTLLSSVNITGLVRWPISQLPGFYHAHKSSSASSPFCCASLV